MLTRIISGAVLVVVVSLIFAANSVNPVITVLCLALLAGIAAFEALYNTKTVKNKIITTLALLYTFIATLCYTFSPDIVTGVTVLYVILTIALSVFFHKEISYQVCLSLICIPVILAFAFNCIYQIYAEGIAFLLLVINFSAICDCGAYFVGVTMGKHKLCPELSPKKTIEGAVGGIASSLIVTVVITFVFSLQEDLVKLLVLTPVLCVVGMVGDLFASLIKRSVGIKDYGKLIPGHGGILDRFDSILLIAPSMIFLLKFSETIL